MTPGLIAVGRVSRPHGLRGELKVRIYSGSTDNLGRGTRIVLAAGETRRESRIEAVRPCQKHFLIRLEGIESLTEAEAFRDAELYLPEEELGDPGEDGYYWSQVVGLEVVDEAGRRLGRVAEVLETPAHDVFVCRTDEGGELLIPSIRQVVAAVDVAGGAVRLRKGHGLT